MTAAAGLAPTISAMHQMLTLIKRVLQSAVAHRDDAARSSACRPEPSGATVVDRNRCPASDGLPRSSSLRPGVKTLQVQVGGCQAGASELWRHNDLVIW